MTTSSTRKKPLPVAPRPTLRGKRLYAFTRHPSALRRVQDLVTRASDRALVAVGLRFAESGEHEGRVVMQMDELAHQAIRAPLREGGSRGDVCYSVHTFNVSARNLRAMGLMWWDHLQPGDRYPSGIETSCGGRVFWFNIPALRGDGPPWVPGTRTPATLSAVVEHAAQAARQRASSSPACTASQPAHEPSEGCAEPPAAELGQSVEASAAAPAIVAPPPIVHDPGGVIVHDRPSDPLVRSFGTNFSDRATRGAAGASAPPTHDDAAASRPPDTPAEYSSAPPLRPSSAPPSPPCAGDAARAIAPTSSSALPRQEHTRGKEHDARHGADARPRRPAVRVSAPATPVDHVQQCLAKLERTLAEPIVVSDAIARRPKPPPGGAP